MPEASILSNGDNILADTDGDGGIDLISKQDGGQDDGVELSTDPMGDVTAELNTDESGGWVTSTSI